MRSCGSCTACCTYLPVSSIGKAALTPCQHLKSPQGEGYTGCEGGNCKAQDDKPEVCAGYSCAWLYGLGAEEDRPDRSGVLIDNLLRIDGALQAKPLRKGAAQTSEGVAAIERMSRESGLPALVAGFPETHIVRVVGRGVE